MTRNPSAPFAALTNAVNRAIAEGSPIYTNQPIGMKTFKATAGMNWIFDLWAYLNIEAKECGHASAVVTCCDGKEFIVSETCNKRRICYIDNHRSSTNAITKRISDWDTAAFRRLHP